MKSVIWLFLASLILYGCSAHKNKDFEVYSIVYTAQSRGFFLNVWTNGTQIWIAKNRNQKPAAQRLTTREIKALKTVFSMLNLDEISTFDAPTSKRMYDGAAHADLIITRGEKTYTSKGFDHGFPPKPLEKIVNLLILYSERQQ